MGFWSFVKKDLRFFRNAVENEKSFHKSMWTLIFPKSSRVGMRRPLSQYYGTLREKRLRQEREVFASLCILWAALTGYLIVSRDWEGFAVWLAFGALVIRSLVIIRELKKGG